MLAEKRKQYFEKDYKLGSHQFRALSNLSKICNLEGKRILEIGGSNFPREMVLQDLKVDKWVSVDVIPQSHYARKRQSKHYQSIDIFPLNNAKKKFDTSNYLIFDGFAENIPSVFFEQFDVVFSVASFEHIHKLSTVIRRIYESLKFGGLLYSHFGPIWSGRVGHHFWVSQELNFNNLGPIPEYAHLLMRPFEMFQYLENYYNRKTCEEVVFQMYFRDYLNRLFFEDYESLMNYSCFEKYESKALNSKQLDNETLSKLMHLYPGRRRFDAYGMSITAHKTK